MQKLGMMPPQPALRRAQIFCGLVHSWIEALQHATQDQVGHGEIRDGLHEHQTGHAEQIEAKSVHVYPDAVSEETVCYQAITADDLVYCHTLALNGFQQCHPFSSPLSCSAVMMAV
jgi:hypothetical protein